MSESVRRKCIVKSNIITGVQFCHKSTHASPATTRQRCTQPDEYLSSIGIRSGCVHLYRTRPVPNRVIVLHRAVFDKFTERFIRMARSSGCLLVYDVDDLLFDDCVAAYFRNNPGTRLKADAIELCRSAMRNCDFVTASTSYLQKRAASFHPRALLIPNGLGASFWAGASRVFQRRDLKRAGSEVVVAYLSGSATHDHDFAIVVPSLIRLLDSRQNVRLLLVGPLRDFSAFDRFGKRVERRGYVPYEEFPDLLAKIDVNLVPLEAARSFCQAKSPLKFIEAGACGVPTVATATGPHKEIILHWDNGCLAEDGDWYSVLCRLVDEPELQRRIGKRARQTVEANYAPLVMAGKWQTLLWELVSQSDAILSSRPSSRSKVVLSWQLESARAERSFRSYIHKARRFVNQLAAGKTERGKLMNKGS